MTELVVRLHNCWDDERAASLVEYLLMVTFIAVLCLVAVATFGTEVSDKFDAIGSQTK